MTLLLTDSVSSYLEQKEAWRDSKQSFVILRSFFKNSQESLKNIIDYFNCLSQIQQTLSDRTFNPYTLIRLISDSRKYESVLSNEINCTNKRLDNLPLTKRTHAKTVLKLYLTDLEMLIKKSKEASVKICCQLFDKMPGDQQSRIEKMLVDTNLNEEQLAALLSISEQHIDLIEQINPLVQSLPLFMLRKIISLGISINDNKSDLLVVILTYKKYLQIFLQKCDSLKNSNLKRKLNFSSDLLLNIWEILNYLNTIIAGEGLPENINLKKCLLICLDAYSSNTNDRDGFLALLKKYYNPMNDTNLYYESILKNQFQVKDEFFGKLKDALFLEIAAFFRRLFDITTEIDTNYKKQIGSQKISGYQPDSIAAFNKYLAFLVAQHNIGNVNATRAYADVIMNLNQYMALLEQDNINLVPDYAPIILNLGNKNKHVIFAKKLFDNISNSQYSAACSNTLGLFASELPEVLEFMLRNRTLLDDPLNIARIIQIVNACGQVKYQEADALAGLNEILLNHAATIGWSITLQLIVDQYANMKTQQECFFAWLKAYLTIPQPASIKAVETCATALLRLKAIYDNPQSLIDAISQTNIDALVSLVKNFLDNDSYYQATDIQRETIYKILKVLFVLKDSQDLRLYNKSISFYQKSLELSNSSGILAKRAYDELESQINAAVDKTEKELKEAILKRAHDYYKPLSPHKRNKHLHFFASQVNDCPAIQDFQQRPVGRMGAASS